MNARLRRVFDLLLHPFRWLLVNPTVHDVSRRIDPVEDAVHRIAARLDELELRLEQFEARVTADTQTAAEFSTTFRRSTDRLRDELHALWGWSTARAEPALAGLLARSAAGDTQADIELAELLLRLAPGVADRLAGAAGKPAAPTPSA